MPGNLLMIGQDISATPEYVFKFNVPATQSVELGGLIAYNRVTDNILSYMEAQLNSRASWIYDIHTQLVERHIGIAIENAIYAMFTDLEDIDYTSQPTQDMDDYVLEHGDTFRQELYIFTRYIIDNCLSHLHKHTEAMNEAGIPIEAYTLNREKYDSTTLIAHVYLGKLF